MSGGAIMRRYDWRGVVLVVAAFCLLPAVATGSDGPPPRASSETATTSDASAQPADTAAAPRITALHAGLDGRFKVGYWAPFIVELEGGLETSSGHVEFVVPDSDGVPSRVRAPATGDLTLAPGERQSVLLYAKLGQLTGEVNISFRGTDGALLTTRLFRAGTQGVLDKVLPSHASIVLSIGESVGAEVATPAGRQTNPRAPQTLPLTRLADFSALPPEWFGLEGVDAIVLHTSDPRMVEQLSASPNQLSALDLWVRMGGRLVLSVGREAPKLLGPGGPLAGLAPGTYDSLVSLRQSTVFETYAESSEPLSPGAPLELRVARLRDTRGRVEAFSGTGPRDLPLVVRTAHGFGEVVFVAFDLDQQPVAGWVAHPQLLNKLLGRSLPKTTAESGGTLGAVTTLGFVDLSGQLRGALDQFSGVRLVPFWLVALLITAYILCIGPIDYYVVRHLLRRPSATWFTFSFTVLLFAAGAAALAFGLKGRELRVNQLDVVDFDAETRFVRGTTWSNVFSPRIDTYNLSLKPAGAPEKPVQAASASSGRLLSWFGLTGTGFGGMDAGGGANGGMGAASTNLPLFSLAYDYAPHLDALEHVPIAVWSSKAFVGRWWGQGVGKIEASLADDGRLTGTIANRLEVPLTNSVLIYDKWAYVVREFAPGREIDLALDVDPQTVDTYLRHVTAVGDHKVVAPFDQSSFDVPRIVELMTAHELAEGKTYTGLANQYQQFVELSDLVRAGRAVLIGQVAKPGAELERDGQPLADSDGNAAVSQRWTFHRYVFPVTAK